MTSQTSASKPIVLAIDDEADNLELISRALNTECEVRGYQSAEAALIDIDAGLRPALVIVDQRMPKITGVQFLEKLGSRGIRCAALLSTGFLGEAEVERAQRSKLVFRVMVKPWDPAELRTQVSLALALDKLNASLK